MQTRILWTINNQQKKLRKIFKIYIYNKAFNISYICIYKTNKLFSIIHYISPALYEGTVWMNSCLFICWRRKGPHVLASVVPCLVADSLNIAFVTSATDNSTTEPTFAVNKANSLMKISVAGFFFWKKPFV